MEAEEKKAKLEELAISAKNMILGLANSEGITDMTMIIAITSSDVGAVSVNGNPTQALKVAAMVVSSVAEHLQNENSEAE